MVIHSESGLNICSKSFRFHSHDWWLCAGDPKIFSRAQWLSFVSTHSFDWRIISEWEREVEKGFPPRSHLQSHTRSILQFKTDEMAQTDCSLVCATLNVLRTAEGGAKCMIYLFFGSQSIIGATKNLLSERAVDPCLGCFSFPNWIRERSENLLGICLLLIQIKSPKEPPHEASSGKDVESSPSPCHAKP
jgi:hypothetical protein